MERDGNGALRADQVLDRPAQEHVIAVDRDIDRLLDLLFDPAPEVLQLGSAGAALARTTTSKNSLLPPSCQMIRLVSPARFAVEQDFLRADGPGFRNVAEPYGDALDVGRAIHDQRLADSQNQFPRGLRCSWAEACASSATDPDESCRSEESSRTRFGARGNESIQIDCRSLFFLQTPGEFGLGALGPVEDFNLIRRQRDHLLRFGAGL